MTGVRIEIDTLRKSWGDTTAVDNISFTAEAGEFTVLLGPSGCGKSTTLRLIAGLEDATSGAVRINGKDVTRRPPNERQIAMVFQSYALFPHLDVAENILFGLKVRKVSAAEQKDRLKRVAALLGLSELLDRRPSQLSGGQQQRVALGRAVIAEKPICLMDEPLSNLDAKLRHEMRVELRALQQKLGLTMVYVTHDQSEAISMADRIVVLNKGRIEHCAPPREIYDRPATTFTARFIGTPPMNLIQMNRFGNDWSIAGTEQSILQGPEDAPAETVMGLRPEDLDVVQGPGLAAKVLDVEYLGADNLVDCQIGSEQLTVRLQHRHVIRPGDTVHLAWRSGSVHLFNAKTEARLNDAGWLALSHPQTPVGETQEMSATVVDGAS